MEKGSKHQRIWGEFLLWFWYLFTFKPPSLLSEQPLDTELVHIHPHKHRGTFTSSSMATHKISRLFEQQSSFPSGRALQRHLDKDKVPCARSGGDLTPLREGLFSVPPKLLDFGEGNSPSAASTRTELPHFCISYSSYQLIAHNQLSTECS